MGARRIWANGLVLGGIAWMAMFRGMDVHAIQMLAQENHSIASVSQLDQLEARASRTPDASTVSALAGAYVDRNQPGLATAVIERAPAAVQARPEVAEVHARALFHRGHARAALAMARAADEACDEVPSCPPWLAAKTARQVAFFEQLVAAGIEDPQQNPAGTRAAYDRSSHAIRLVAMR